MLSSFAETALPEERFTHIEHWQRQTAANKVSKPSKLRTKWVVLVPVQCMSRFGESESEQSNMLCPGSPTFWSPGDRFGVREAAA